MARRKKPSVSKDALTDDEQQAALPHVYVHRQFLRGGRVLAEELEDYKDDELPLIKARQFPTGVVPARVGTSIFQQWSLGGDNLVATTIICTTPCLQEEANEAYEWADRFVTEKMQVESQKIEKLRRRKKKKGSE